MIGWLYWIQLDSRSDSIGLVIACWKVAKAGKNIYPWLHTTPTQKQNSNNWLNAPHRIAMHTTVTRVESLNCIGTSKWSRWLLHINAAWIACDRDKTFDVPLRTYTSVEFHRRAIQCDSSKVEWSKQCHWMTHSPRAQQRRIAVPSWNMVQSVQSSDRFAISIILLAVYFKTSYCVVCCFFLLRTEQKKKKNHPKIRRSQRN